MRKVDGVGGTVSGGVGGHVGGRVSGGVGGRVGGRVSGGVGGSVGGRWRREVGCVGGVGGGVGSGGWCGGVGRSVAAVWVAVRVSVWMAAGWLWDGICVELCNVIPIDWCAFVKNLPPN